MITYTVTYRKATGFSLRKKIRKVKGDGFTESNLARFFVLEDETRVEIPIEGIRFDFSKERFNLIRERMEIEAGGAPLKVVPR